MSTIARRLELQYPDTNAGWGVWIASLRDYTVAGRRPAAAILMTTVLLVLLIACTNIAGVQLARTAGRGKEIAVRLALGAGRFRIIRQILVEGVLLAIAGGVLGLLLTAWLFSILLASYPELREFVIDGTVLGYTTLVSVLTGIVFGLAPALAGSKADVNSALKAGGAMRLAASGSRMRGLLVVGEFTLVLVLLAGTGALLESFWRLRQVDRGIRANHLLTMNLVLPEAKYAQPQQRAAFFQQAVERIGHLPGVRSASAVSLLPIAEGNANYAFEIEGRSARAQDDFIRAGYRTVSPDYFQTFGIPLHRGRAFTSQDRDGNPPVVIINEKMAEMFWPGYPQSEDPGREANQVWRASVVDDCRDCREVRSSGLGPAFPEMFASYAQDPGAAMALGVRTETDPMSFAAAAKSEVRSLDRDLPVFYVRSMEEILYEQVVAVRYIATLTGAFSAIALGLAALGLYGVISFFVAQRTQEFGIRLALGAQKSELLRLVLKQGAKFVAAGLAIGLPAGYGLMRVLSGELAGVTAANPCVLAGVALFLSAVALAASYVPALRATRIDPMTAVRYE